MDPYLYPPEGNKLRSGNDLIDFVTKHPHYWPTFDPTVINFERSAKTFLMLCKLVNVAQNQTFRNEVTNLISAKGSNIDNVEIDSPQNETYETEGQSQILEQGNGSDLETECCSSEFEKSQM